MASIDKGTFWAIKDLSKKGAEEKFFKSAGNKVLWAGRNISALFSPFSLYSFSFSFKVSHFLWFTHRTRIQLCGRPSFGGFFIKMIPPLLFLYAFLVGGGGKGSYTHVYIHYMITNYILKCLHGWMGGGGGRRRSTMIKISNITV